MRLLFVLAAFVLAASALGCVKRSEYDAKVAEASRCQQDLNSAAQWAAMMNKQDADLKAQLESQRTKANQDLAELQKQLDDSTALVASLKAELQRMGADVDKLVKERGSLASSLEQARKRLDELRKAEEAAQRRADAMRNLIDRFKKMADAGQLKVTVRRGRMVLQLPNDVLFDSGRADIKPAGQATLSEVGRILASIPNRQFQVAGHTDNRPITTAQFPSNWYLSTARAVKVVEFLTRGGMAPHTLSATGYGEFDPIASNDSDDGRAKNRRIEITIQPNVDELLTTGNL